MRIRVFTAVIVLLSMVQPSFAHRLDEYLQSTKISVARDRVDVDMRLTPGVAVLTTILEAADADKNGRISDEEQQAYVERVRNDLSLSIDGTRVSLRVTSQTFPDAGPMAEGLGDIEIHLEAPVLPGKNSRTLVFDNHHLPKVSVYLVNCLVPSDPGIHITSQSRSYDQSSFRLAYAQTDMPLTVPTAFMAAHAQETSPSLFQGYVLHGVRHILTGYDHLLFVSALVLAATGLLDLIKLVSAFTLAHTLTMTLAALGVVHVAPRIVEPCIAASIVVVALQNVLWPSRKGNWGRLGAAFFFGLFHGLGFAGGLLNAMRELPSGAMLLSILAFGVGVELGHQIVVLPLFSLLTAVRQTRQAAGERTALVANLRRYLSIGISVAGLYYLFIALTPSQ